MGFCSFLLLGLQSMVRVYVNALVHAVAHAQLVHSGVGPLCIKLLWPFFSHMRRVDSLLVGIYAGAQER